jgi:hypothetical protein
MSVIALELRAASSEAGADDLVVAAAEYLALPPAELEARLEAGWSMGEIACLRGRSIDGLFDVLLVHSERALVDVPHEAQLRAVEHLIVTERTPVAPAGGARG